MVSSSALQPALRVGIIGLGPHGLVILERLLKVAERDPSRTLAITVFEPNQPGVGLHGVDQPDYLLLNTIASQLGMYPDGPALASKDPRDGRQGPDFLAWCHKAGIHVDDNGQVTVDGGRPVQATDFLPRRLLGEYLTHVFDALMDDKPEHVSIHLYNERATRVVKGVDQDSYLLEGESGIQARVDRLFIAIGHSDPQPTQHAQASSKRTIRNVYPMPESFIDIPPGARVGLEGFGLVAMDALAALSAGRGGRFERNGGQVRYIASGQEPRITLFSRCGLPFRVRPETAAGRAKHQALLMTPARIAQLRADRPDQRLDFDQDVLPLMLAEMRAVYHLTKMAQRHTHARQVLYAELRQAAQIDLASLLAILDHLDADDTEAFDPRQHLLHKLPDGLQDRDYAAWVRRYIEADLEQGLRGLHASPLKAALEVWRDLRDALRSVVDFHGLTTDSHRRFFSTYAGLVNRTVAGPQKERHQDLLALIDAGIVTIAAGVKSSLRFDPENEHHLLEIGQSERTTLTLDWIIEARAVTDGLISSNSPVIRDLHRAGLLRATVASPGLDAVDVDPDHHPYDASGQAIQSLWLFGPMIEGATYYNHYVPSAGAFSRAFADAHRAALSCLQAAHQHPTQGATP
ncbi:FAD/NAD(P)-binding protein [Paraherbaspirillum soli]|uniref:FAD/NAD(P)-binding protein n=1 Tax=Paraherbaspirillum soli TaxID=631222 RepID=A0ABW0M6R3_9BURK